MLKFSLQYFYFLLSRKFYYPKFSKVSTRIWTLFNKSNRIQPTVGQSILRFFAKFFSGTVFALRQQSNRLLQIVVCKCALALSLHRKFQCVTCVAFRVVAFLTFFGSFPCIRRIIRMFLRNILETVSRMRFLLNKIRSKNRLRLKIP